MLYKHVERKAKLIGVVGKNIESIFSKQVTGKYIAKGQANEVSYRTDVINFTRMHKKHKLFENHESRDYKTFANFENKIPTRTIPNLKERLAHYSKSLDKD